MQKNMSEKQILRAIREPGSPATPAQLNYIGILHLAVSSSVTKGEAAVLIHNTLKNKKGVKVESCPILSEKT